MRAALLAGALMLASGPAFAQSCSTDPVTGDTFCDPTAFHLSSPTATGSDPVFLNDSNTFTIDLVGNHTINQPLHILFIEAPGTALSISSITGVGSSGAFSIGPTATSTQLAFDTTNRLFDGPQVTISSTQDLAKQINLPGGDTSLSYANFAAAFMAKGLTLPTTFEVFAATIPEGFNANSPTDFVTVNGNFGLGTIIAPFALDITQQSNGKFKVDVFDTSWTNAGVVNQLSSPVPELRTWAMLALGFGLLGFIGMRRKREARLAL